MNTIDIAYNTIFYYVKVTTSALEDPVAPVTLFANLVSGDGLHTECEKCQIAQTPFVYAADISWIRKQ